MKNSNPLKIKIYLSLFFIILPILFFGQETKYRFVPHWYLNANAGISYNHGDVAKYLNFPELPDFNNISPGGEFGFGRQITSVFGFNAKAYRGFLKGASPTGETFESDLYDLSLNATVNFRNLIGGFADRKLNFYGHGGIGQVQFKTKVIDERGTTSIGYDGSSEEFRGTGINGRKIAMIFPFTLGLDYQFSDKIQINTGFTLKITDSDLLDGREVGSNNDWYNFSYIGLRYNLGKTKKAIPLPKIEKPVQEKVIPKPVFTPEPVEEIVEKVVVEPPVYVAPKPVETKLYYEYRVQIRASYKQPLLIYDLSQKYNINQSDIVFGGNYKNWYIYTVGSFASREEAERKCNILIKNNGVLDAFIVEFENGKRIKP